DVTGIETEPAPTGPVNTVPVNTGTAGVPPAGVTLPLTSEPSDPSRSALIAGGTPAVPVVSRICGVMTSRGFVSTRIVVNAAGPWAAEVARLAGVDLPLQPLRRQLVPTEPFDGLPHRFPMVIDMSTGFHFRREGKG